MNMATFKQTQPLLEGGVDLPLFHRRLPSQKEKVVIVLGATGTGKSRLSIDLATHFPAEIINSDKMQVHKGLDITTNKITPEESQGIPHHLFSVIDPNVDFTATNFCNLASTSLQSITSREQLPIIVGGSNSFVEALVDDKNKKFRSKYECCFLWVDVSIPILHSFLSDRVDRMLERGLINEVRAMFNPNNDPDLYSRGIFKAISVPELDHYFRMEPFLGKKGRARLLEKAVKDIKINTCKLAYQQLEKIHKLKNVKKWKLHRLDATDVFKKCGKDADEAWENHVMEPSIRTVGRFLYNLGPTFSYNDDWRPIATTSTTPAPAASTY
ncbi:hypothetical protein Leryth_004913 [Lithospermum erythrorhizon]|nr:hypothetical protein Leryth_004913 [Lithospermum erythrorhizon]